MKYYTVLFNNYKFIGYPSGMVVVYRNDSYIYRYNEYNGIKDHKDLIRSAREYIKFMVKK